MSSAYANPLARDQSARPRPDLALLPAVRINQVWYVRNRTEAYEAVVVGFQGDRVAIRHAALPHATPTLALRSMFTNQPDGFTLERDAW